MSQSLTGGMKLEEQAAKPKIWAVLESNQRPWDQKFDLARIDQ